MELSEAIERRDAARERYAHAVRGFRASYAELAAFDQLLRDHGDHSPGFGMIFDVTWLQNSSVNPDESGSLSSDIRTIIEATRIEG